MKKYHVHIYQISGMAEYDLEAENDESARAKALKHVTENNFSIQFPDCKQIAIAFEVDK